MFELRNRIQTKDKDNKKIHYNIFRNLILRYKSNKFPKFSTPLHLKDFFFSRSLDYSLTEKIFQWTSWSLLLWNRKSFASTSGLSIQRKDLRILQKMLTIPPYGPQNIYLKTARFSWRLVDQDRYVFGNSKLLCVKPIHKNQQLYWLSCYLINIHIIW